MEKIVALCKRRGFIYPGSEIYGGLAGTWDYGPLGTLLKKNIKDEWWKSIVQLRSDVVGVDAAIMMNPIVWQKSGHLKAFTDPLVECKTCHKRFRADQIEGIEKKETSSGEYWKIRANTSCPTGGHELDVGEIEFKPKKFNLLVKAYLGVIEGAQDEIYLRGEITQGAFVNFENVVSSTRVKIPFGIAQIGKAFRNEITPGNFTFRSREFEQMELEFFIRPESAEGEKWFSYWKNERMKWYVSLGIKKENLRFRKHEDKERAHYAKFAEDIEYNSPFGWSEFEGIHNRGDFDLSAHNLSYVDETGGKYTPWVVETSGGIDRSLLFFLLDAYSEEEGRTILKLHPKLAPYKVAVFPLLANKEDLVSEARKIYQTLQKEMMVAWDDRGNIGKRYFTQDEAGTPFCITVDFQTLEDKTVTVRDRDSAKQERIAIDKLSNYLEIKLK